MSKSCNVYLREFDEIPHEHPVISETVDVEVSNIGKTVKTSTMRLKYKEKVVVEDLKKFLQKQVISIRCRIFGNSKVTC